MSRKSKPARKRSSRPPVTVPRPAASAAPEIADVEAPVEQPVSRAARNPATGTETNPTPSVPAPPGAGTGPRRGVGRIEPGAAGRRRERAPRPGSLSSGFEPLDPDDPAIPYDRVPYVPADLRRVAIIAGAMILLILLADFIVSHAVK